MRGATMFSGGGGVEALLKNEIQFVNAVEYDPQIAPVYVLNIGPHVQVARVEDVDYTTWGALDYLHASPSCTRASQANSNGGESEDDLSAARAVVRCLEATQPRVFTLENVQQYASFQSYRLICQALDRAGYMWHAEVLNAADMGVPQTRRRLILRAVLGALLPGLPAPVRRVGWYEAIEDLIPTLPDSAFATWQLARLPEELRGVGLLIDGANTKQEFGKGYRSASEPMVTVTSNGKTARAFIVDGKPSNHAGALQIALPHEPINTVTASQSRQPMRAWLVSNQATMDLRADVEPALAVTATTAGKAAMPKALLFSNAATEYGDGIRHEDEPAHSVTTQSGGRTRALLVHANDQRSMPTRWEDEPAFTITAGSHNTHAPDTKPKAWLAHGRVVKMTPRALARFQSVPDWYELPERTALACRIIGNMAPPLMMREIVLPLLEVTR